MTGEITITEERYRAYQAAEASVATLHAGISAAAHEAEKAIRRAERAEAEVARLRAAIKAVIDGDYPNPRDHRPGNCKHGVFYWEDCHQCIDEWLTKALAEDPPVQLGPELVQNPEFSTDVDGWATVIDARGPDATVTEQGDAP